MRHLNRLAICALATASLAFLAAANWPQFRGPAADGVAADAFPQNWDAQTNLRWEFENPGEGWSCPVVWGDKVFLTAAVMQSPPEETAQGGEGEDRPPRGEGRPPRGEGEGRPPRGEGGGFGGPGGGRPGGGRGRGGPDLSTATFTWEVYCLDANTGEIVWKEIAREGNPRIGKHSSNTFASETPVCDGEHLYVYFGMHGLYCYDLAGNLEWEQDLGVYPLLADWGSSSSPVLWDEKLYLQIDNEEDSFLVALNAADGEELWRVPRDEPTQYSTPLVWENSQRVELVTGGQVCRSYDPESGDLLWSLDMSRGRSSASPIAAGDLLLIGNEERRQGGPDQGGGGLYAVKAGATGDITPAEGAAGSEGVEWICQGTGIAMASPVVCQGYIFILQRRGGIVSCVRLEDGELLYVERVPGARAFWASPWTDGELVYCLDDGGTTHVMAPGEELDIVDTNELAGQFWSTPALADGAVYLRAVDRLYCIGE